MKNWSLGANSCLYFFNMFRPFHVFKTGRCKGYSGILTNMKIMYKIFCWHIFLRRAKLLRIQLLKEANGVSLTIV